MISHGIVLLLICLLCACSEKHAITIDKPIDLQRYSGKWYELASFPTHFGNECSCTIVEYTIHKDHIDVKNSCSVTMRHQQHVRAITGRAYPIPGTQNSYWSIEFYWPLKANYWIVYVSDDYQYALVSEPSKKYLWMLARKPDIDSQTYERLLERLRRLGFDLNLLKISRSCSIK